MGLALGLSRLTVWRNLLRAQKKGYQGNKKGEGFVLGGVYVIGAGKQVRFLGIRTFDPQKVYLLIPVG